jgi:transcriptional regulator
MYIPEYSHNHNFEEIYDFITKYPFGILITAKDSLPIANHLPFVIERRGETILLSTHLAKANDQWRDLVENDCLVIFSEPNAPIDATKYAELNNVPTWNFIAVHLYGSCKIMKDETQVKSKLMDMIDKFNPEYKSQMNVVDKDYLNKMLEGIVTIDIKVSDIQAKFKLSQNKTKKERENLIKSLEHSKEHNKLEIANYMRKV